MFGFVLDIFAIVLGVVFCFGFILWFCFQNILLQEAGIFLSLISFEVWGVFLGRFCLVGLLAFHSLEQSVIIYNLQMPFLLKLI